MCVTALLGEQQLPGFKVQSKHFFFEEEVKTVTSIFFSSVENNCVTKAALIKQKTSEICLILSNHTFFIYVTKWIKSVIH